MKKFMTISSLALIVFLQFGVHTCENNYNKNVCLNTQAETSIVK